MWQQVRENSWEVWWEGFPSALLMQQGTDITKRVSLRGSAFCKFPSTRLATLEDTAAQGKACDSARMLKYFTRWSVIDDNRFLSKVREQNIGVGEHHGQVWE